MEFLSSLVTGNEKLILGSLFTLSGVIIAGVINITLKSIEMWHTRKMKKIELASSFKNENLFKPVIAFLDSDLAAMQSVYALIFIDKKDINKVKIENDHVSQISSIEARVKALTDKDTYAKFKEFSRKRRKIRNSVENRKNDPYDELKSAIDLASEIMSLLYEQAIMINTVQKLKKDA